MKSDGSFSKAEQILMHIQNARRFMGEMEAPRAYTQNGIAEAIRTDRANVSLRLRELRALGIIEERLAHVKPLARQVKIYAPTLAGYQLAKALSYIKEMKQ